MSHLRQPSARADRREGGRHGRPGPRTVQPLPETQIRRQLLRTAVLPAAAVALCGAAAVFLTLRWSGGVATPELWAVLIGSGVIAVTGVAAAARSADRWARSLLDRLAGMRRTSARGQADLRELVEQLRRGEGPPQRRAGGVQLGVRGDELDQLAGELGRAHEVAVAAVVQASQLSSHAGSEQKVEVFVNLARRLQSLVHREIQLLDELENDVEDPELLKGLFHVDHLATRIRRHAENLAVLGGAISRRQWSKPVTMTEVLRSAIAEVEQYPRVKLVPPIEGTLRGHAVADVIHLLAELVENASLFSSPHTQVLLRASYVTAGLAVEVEDRGLGMPVTEQNKMNALLSDPDQVNVASLLSDGRIGLFVVSALARRHGVAVRLQSNIYGGVQAVIVLPQGLLGPEAQQQQGQATQNQVRVQEQEQEQGRLPGQNQDPAQIPQATQSAQATPIPQAPQPPEQAPAGDRIPAPATKEPAQVSGSATAATAATRTAPAAAPVSAASSTAPTTSTAYVPHQPQRHEAPVATGPEPAAQPGGAERSATGASQAAAGNAPLPVRGTQEERPSPAGAVPGIRPDERPTHHEHPERQEQHEQHEQHERHTVPEHHAAPAPSPSADPSADPTADPAADPAADPVRGTMGRPQLPKRRAQEHLAPQLRDAPVHGRGDGQIQGHDPGLMAAFQRGIGLAEAQPERRGEPAPAPYGETFEDEHGETFKELHPDPLTAPLTELPDPRPAPQTTRHTSQHDPQHDPKPDSNVPNAPNAPCPQAPQDQQTTPHARQDERDPAG
ncbi:ATP-binding protein [Streptomyces sp. NPDC002851]